MRIEDLDKNFAAQSADGLDWVYLPLTSSALEVDGLPYFKSEKKLCRMSQAALPAQTLSVQDEAWMPAGVQVRFRTNSRRIAVMHRLRRNPNVAHMPMCGNSGFDLYLGVGSGKRFCGSSNIGYGKLEYTSVLWDISKYEQSEDALYASRPILRPIAGTDLREVTINFPTYNIVDDVAFGLEPGSTVQLPAPFAIEKPIVFYGSSITQGGSASRPGLNYIQILSRRLDAHTVNLGFSGSAKAEEPMNAFLAGLEMSVFVMDYDHNAPNSTYLESTHEKLFKTIRASQPELPVVFMSKPDFDSDAVINQTRLEIIQKTYFNAMAAGDRNVYFIDGRLLLGSRDRDSCSDDGCHPNVLGFYRMADAVEPVLRQALGI